MPLASPLHDRHIRFVGDNGGVFGEAVRGLTRLGIPLWSGHALAGVAWCDWRDGLLDGLALLLKP